MGFWIRSPYYRCNDGIECIGNSIYFGAKLRMVNYVVADHKGRDCLARYCCPATIMGRWGVV
jgi:hypothetical protein